MKVSTFALCKFFLSFFLHLNTSPPILKGGRGIRRERDASGFANFRRPAINSGLFTSRRWTRRRRRIFYISKWGKEEEEELEPPSRNVSKSLLLLWAGLRIKFHSAEREEREREREREKGKQGCHYGRFFLKKGFVHIRSLL